MKAATRLILLIAALFGGVLTYAQSAPFPHPPSGQSQELGKVLLMLMPERGQRSIPWDHRADSIVKWADTGYATETDSQGHPRALRRGLVRINVMGSAPTVLRKRREEMWWSVTYLTQGPVQFGAQSIHLVPGTPFGLPHFRAEPCFGSLYEGCSFRVLPSLDSAGIHVSRVCRGRYFSAHIQGFTLAFPGREPVQLRVMDDEGSGGASTSVELLFAEDSKKLCSIE